LCTSDLGDDDRSLQLAIQRAGLSQIASAGPPPRASLDESAWSRLRHSCPARQGSPEIDLKIARRLLDDPVLYSEALHAGGGNPSIAAAPAAASPEPALTEAGRKLSSTPRNP
jgi:carboxyl-terminal processing protease